MTNVNVDDLSEFDDIDIDAIHLVGEPASRFAPLMQKAADQQKGPTKMKTKKLMAKAAVVGQAALAEMDADFEAAKARYEAHPNAMNRAQLQQSGWRRMLLRMIQRDNAAEKSMVAIQRSIRGQGNPLFSDTSTHGLRDDRGIEYR